MRDLQITAINDVAFLTHPFIAPTRLSRVSDTSWILEPIPFDYYPTAIENTDPEFVQRFADIVGKRLSVLRLHLKWLKGGTE